MQADSYSKCERSHWKVLVEDHLDSSSFGQCFWRGQWGGGRPVGVEDGLGEGGSLGTLSSFRCSGQGLGFHLRNLPCVGEEGPRQLFGGKKKFCLSECEEQEAMRIHRWPRKAKPRPGSWSLGQNPVEMAWEADLPPAPQNEKGRSSGVRCEGACCSS